MGLIDIAGLFGSVSYVIIILATSLRNILYLRLMTILSTMCGAIYFSFYTSHPLWINLFWETLFILVNGTQILILLWERNNLSFASEEEKVIYHLVFRRLTPTQFRKLLQVGKHITAPAGTKLTEQGEAVAEIAILAKGLASVTVDNEVIAHCKAGDFVGEMSFISGQPATASVELIEPTQYITWRQEDLRSLLERDQSIGEALQSVFSSDLLGKLTRISKQQRLANPQS